MNVLRRFGQVNAGMQIECMHQRDLETNYVVRAAGLRWSSHLFQNDKGATVSAPHASREPGGAKWGAVERPHIVVRIGADKVDMGVDVSVARTKFDYVLGTEGDSRREMARLLWTMDKLREHTATGAACRRLLKEGALTPKKMRALAGAYTEYMEEKSNQRGLQQPSAKPEQIHAYLAE